MRMNVIFSNAQHTGCRDEQQDAFGFSDPALTPVVQKHGVVAVLADGMGGHMGGAEAAQTAVTTFIHAWEVTEQMDGPCEALQRALDLANSAVHEQASSRGENGGSTLVAAAVHGDTLAWISVGDSRLYIFREGVLQQLTTDHSYAARLDAQVEAGLLSADEAAASPYVNALTSSLGQEDVPEVDRCVTPEILYAEDTLLLCSDGLYRTLDDSEIIAAMSGDPAHAAERIVDAVIAKGAPRQDNVTVVTMTVTADPAVRRPFLVAALLVLIAMVIVIVASNMAKRDLPQSPNASTTVQSKKADSVKNARPDSASGTEASDSAQSKPAAKQKQ